MSVVRSPIKTVRPRRRGRLCRVLLTLVPLALLLSACSDISAILQRFLLKTDEIIVERRPDIVYEQLFPHYVELHPQWTRRDNWTLEDFVVEHSIFADFALQFSRNVFCARIPVTETIVDEVIQFLNDKNYEYATTDVDYNWNLLANNCTHTVRNALAAANVWSSMSVREIKLLHLLNLAVPANEFVNLSILGAEEPIEDYREFARNAPLRDALHETAAADPSRRARQIPARTPA